MQTGSIFDNIEEKIQDEINKVHKSIFMAITWFANKALLDELVSKSGNGCTASLIIQRNNYRMHLKNYNWKLRFNFISAETLTTLQNTNDIKGIYNPI